MLAVRLEHQNHHIRGFFGNDRWGTGQSSCCHQHTKTTVASHTLLRCARPSRYLGVQGMPHVAPCVISTMLMLLLFWQTLTDHGRRLRSISSNYLSVLNPATLPAFSPKEVSNIVPLPLTTPVDAVPVSPCYPHAHSGRCWKELHHV